MCMKKPVFTLLSTANATVYYDKEYFVQQGFLCLDGVLYDEDGSEIDRVNLGCAPLILPIF